jgi:metal-sulfur cluster biosynthetic enzyme
MGQAPHTVWLQPTVAPPAGGCSGCVSTASGPVCRSALAGEPCVAPELKGDSETLNRVMMALNAEVKDDTTGRGIVDLHWVKALRIEGDEAERTVTFPPSCGGGKALAEDAFATLRRHLPDTDVYVWHK